MSLLISGTLLALCLAPKTDVFVGQGPYTESVPSPQAILGYGPGEKHTTYFDQQRYLEAIQRAAPDRVKLIEYGKSTQGRPLRILVIGDPERMQQLDSIQQANLRLAQGVGTESDQKIPSIVWINETIHGDEAASFESGMWLIYNLVAGQSEQLKRARQNSLVVVNPCYNADGHERFVVWYNSVANGTNDPNAFEYSEPKVVDGRTNHYRFDLNRDRVAMSQRESQAEAAEFRKWMPHVYVDQHGEVSTYFFPPAAMAMNKNIDRKRYNKWTEMFGVDTAKAFDNNGYSYYVRDIFDLYYPGYMDSFTTLNGSVGMTHETDGQLLSQSNADGSERSLRLGMAKHFTSALAVIESASRNQTELVRSFSDFRKQNLSGDAFGPSRNYALVSETELEAKRLQTQLDHLGIAYRSTYGLGEAESAESLWSREAEKVSKRGYWTVIDLAQPNGALAKALLEPESDFEPEFTAEQLRRKKEGEWGSSMT